MKTIIEIKEQGNLRYKLIVNSFSNGDYNYSVIEELIKGNSALGDNSQLDIKIFNTLKQASKYFNKQIGFTGLILPK
jgi:hypothetical protein